MEFFNAKHLTMGLPSGIYWLLFALVLLINQDTVLAQTKRAPRAGPTSRSLGINPQRSSSSTSAASVEFDCPEEFGYYPHPNDCSQYYVCVFGGALQESCTGGLMYSHELQTCDWPRNVGCEVSERSSPTREDIPRLVQVPSRIRFSSVGSSGLTGPSGLANERQPQIQQQPQHHQQHQQQQQQHHQHAVQAQIQQIQQLRTLPPPPEPLRVAPNPEITPRGQPKHLPQDDIVKLYSEAHDTLQPAEEEENDRQQRVYRGQPSTVGQVQRDRDGTLIQPSVNAIPTQQKIGSFAFSTPPPYSDKQLQDLDEKDQMSLDRKKRSVEQTNSTLTDTVSTNQTESESKIALKRSTDITDDTKNWDSDVANLTPELINISEDVHPSIDISNFFDSDEILAFLKNSSDIPISGLEGIDFSKNVSSEESLRRARQLSALTRSPSWPFVNQNNFRALDFFSNKQNSFHSPPHKQHEPSSHPTNDGSYFLSSNYKSSNNEGANYNSPYVNNYNKNKYLADFKSSSYTNNFNHPPNNGNFKSTYKITPQDAIIPLFYTTPASSPHYNNNNNNNNNYKANKYTTAEPNDETMPENFAYYHLKKGQSTPNPNSNIYKPSPPFQQASTTRNPFVVFNSIGGFFNNQQNQDVFRPSVQYASPTSPPQHHVTNLASASPYSANFGDDKTRYTAFNTQKIYPTTPLYPKSPPSYASTPAPVYEHNNLNHPSQTVRFPISTPKPQLISPSSPYSHNVFLNNINFKKPHQQSFIYQGGEQQQYYTQDYGASQPTPKSNAFYIVKTTLNPTVKPIITSTTPRYAVQQSNKNLDYERLVTRVRNNHITQLSPKYNTGINFKNVTSLQQVPKYNYYPSTTKKPTVDDYYDSSEEDDKDDTRERQPNKLNTPRPNYGYSNQKKPNYIQTNQQTENYSDESEEDDEYYEDDDDEDSKPPPQLKPQYFPMSETMAPKPYNNYDYIRTTTTSFRYNQPETTTTAWNIRNEYKPATTTVAPTTSSIPSIIQFPDDDVFRDIIPRYLNKSTLRPYTVRHRLKPTIMPSMAEEMTTVSMKTRKTTRPVITTTTFAPITKTTTNKSSALRQKTTRKIYTIRPSRGNLRWKTTKSTNKRPTDTNSKLTKNSLELDEKLPNRVESSSPATNSYQPQKPLYDQQNNNKNYYNTTNYNPSNYDSYFSLYDDDVELYRNVDYSSQYNTNTQKPAVSSTYRPSTTVTAIPQQTYVAQQQPQQPQQPQYERPAQQNIYNTDYDDALVSQLDGGNTYREPVKTQLRGDRNDINSISDSPISSTLRTYNPKYSSPTFVSTPVPFSLSPTTTSRPTTTTYSTTTYSTTKAPQTQYATQRSTLSEDINNNKTSPIITLAARAGPPTNYHHSLSLKPVYDSYPDHPSTTTLANNPILPIEESSSSSPYEGQFQPTKHDSNSYKLVQTTQNENANDQIKPQFSAPSNVVSLSAGFIYNNEKSSKNNYFSENFVAKNRKTQSPHSEWSTTPGTTTLQKITTTASHQVTSPPAKDYERQRNKLLSFIVSDVQPESFKPALPASFNLYNVNNNFNRNNSSKNNKNYVNFSNSNTNRNFYYTANTSSAKPTTILTTTTTSTTTPRLPFYQFSLPKSTVRIATDITTEQYNNEYQTTTTSTRNNNGRLKYTQSPIIVPLYSRPAYQEQPYRISTSDEPEAPKQSEYFEATTYLPKKQWAPEVEEKLPATTKAPKRQFDDGKYRTKSTTTTTTTTSAPIMEFQTAPTSVEDVHFKSLLESVQSFTSRGLIFKEALNKSLVQSTTSKQYVSPFKSLESLRHADAYKTSSIKPFLPTSTRSFVSFFRNSSNTPETTTLAPTSTTKPYRSYFLITTSPKIVTLKQHPASTKVYLPTTVASIGKRIPTWSATTVPTTTVRTTITTTTKPTTTVQYVEPKTRPTTTISTTTEARSLESESYESDYTETKRGRFRPYISYTTENSLETEDPTTYSPKLRYTIKHTASQEVETTTTELPPQKKKPLRLKTVSEVPSKAYEKDSYDYNSNEKPRYTKKYDVNDKKSEYFTSETKPSPFASAEEDATRRWQVTASTLIATTQSPNVVRITDKPIYFTKYTYEPRTNSTFNKFLVEEPVTKRFRATVEMPEMHVPTESQIKAFAEKENDKSEDVDSNGSSDDLLPNEEELESYEEDAEAEDLEDYAFIETVIPTSSPKDLTLQTENTKTTVVETTTFTPTTTKTPPTTTTTVKIVQTTSKQTTMTTETTSIPPTTTMTTTTVMNNPKNVLPRASRVNNAIKTSIASASQPQKVKPSATKTCSDNTPNAKCNEIPLRTNTRNRGSSQYTTADQGSTSSSNRGTHPPRVVRPTLKPSKSIVSSVQEYVDIYRFPPTRPEALYPQPTPDKTAAKCRKDVCLLPDCYCGGKDIPADLEAETLPQIVLLTFDDSVNDLNKQLYADLFERGRVNPNGCPISATFYVSHEWTDYSQVQNLYSDGHEIASHTISHSFGEQFSIKKWAREVAGQREVIAAYAGVKLEDVRGMRAPFLSIGGNKMFKMLHDFNFTYDSSMPVYENRPPSYPYTLDYKIFHDCMIPPCPTKSYPGVWEVPMVMWQDLNGGRCSMGDACSNPAESENVFKMIMKNFERHYTTNRAPFGLFYHAAWFTQPHHKEGFIKFLDAINAMKDVYIVTNWQALQWVRDPTPANRLSNFQPFQCNYQDRPKRCNNAKVCNLWHKSGVRYMRTCQPCPEIYPWTGKTGIRSSRIDNDLEIVESN